jgi:hypothetical protein
MVFNRSKEIFETIGEITASLTDFDRQLLQLLDEGQDATTIAKALKSDVKTVALRIAQMIEFKLIGGGKVTDLGKRLTTNDTLEFEVRFKYALRTPTPPLKTESREFCQQLMSLNRLYSRDEIETISGRVNRNVWNYRGGYWTNADTGVTTPYCRHIWNQQLIVKKDAKNKAPILTEVPRLTEVPKDLTIEKVKNGVVNNTIKDLDLPDIDVTYKKLTGNTGGQVSFVKQSDGSYKMGKKIDIDVDKYKDNPEKLAQIIRHELRHIYQSEKMGYYIKDGHFYWNNQKNISTKEYNKILNKATKAKTKEEYDKAIKAYRDLPWEKDADTYMLSLIFSAEKPFIDTITDDLPIDLIPLPDELIKELGFNFFNL